MPYVRSRCRRGCTHPESCGGPLLERLPGSCRRPHCLPSCDGACPRCERPSASRSLPRRRGCATEQVAPA
eukprot:scaffold54609_cov71-Phaeocystis_antarctica.AAC.1